MNNISIKTVLAENMNKKNKWMFSITLIRKHPLFEIKLETINRV